MSYMTFTSQHQEFCSQNASAKQRSAGNRDPVRESGTKIGDLVISPEPHGTFSFLLDLGGLESGSEWTPRVEWERCKECKVARMS